MKESNCSLFAKEIINGVGGFKVWEGREFVVHTDRDIAIAEWVIRCLANQNNPLAEQVLSEITNHRTDQGGRNAALKWNEGAPETPGSYLIRFNTFSEEGIDIFFASWDDDDILFRSRRILAHIGPIPPPPQNDEQ